jgi:hypothetical protein
VNLKVQYRASALKTKEIKLFSVSILLDARAGKKGSTRVAFEMAAGRQSSTPKAKP